MTLPHLAQSIRQSIDGVDQPVEVVFIGDDPELADMYRVKLQLDGYDVRLITTEQAKSDPSRMQTPDLVYLDIGLLNPAGLATHRRLRAQTGTKYVPIVLLSARLARDFPMGLKLSVHDFVISSDTVRPEGFWSEYSGVMVARH